VRVPWLEAVLTIGIGLLLYFPLKNRDLGSITWSIGALITVSQLKSEFAIQQEFKQVQQLAETLDLTQSSSVSELRDLYSVYLRITEEEFAPVKNSIVREAMQSLLALANDKVSSPLPSGEYYSWILPMLEKVPSGTTIRAISLMMAAEWDNSPSERKFLESSIAAATRGVEIRRIFVTARATMVSALPNEAIRAHMSRSHPASIRGYFVDVDWLQERDPTLHARLGEGFISFGDHVALVDVFSPNGEARGRVTMNSAELTRLMNVFSQLEVHSEEVAEDFH